MQINDTAKDCFWCGGDMINIADGLYICAYCGWQYKESVISEENSEEAKDA